MKTGALALLLGIVLLGSACNQENNTASGETRTENVALANPDDPTVSQTNAQDGEYPKMVFDEQQFDFGSVDQGDVVIHKFTFTNSGKVPLIISDVTASCGCTTPSYTKEPVQPGEKGEILVQFNTEGKAGYQNKTVTVKANTLESTMQLLLKGVVVDPTQAGPRAN